MSHPERTRHGINRILVNMGSKSNSRGSKARIKDLMSDGVIRIGVQSQKMDLQKILNWYFLGSFEFE